MTLAAPPLGRRPAGIRSCHGFLRLWGAQAVSQVGDQIYLLALPWLVYDLTGSGSQMALVFSFETLPYVLFGVLGGAASDRGSRRAILVAGSAAAAVVVGALAALARTGTLATWHVYVASLALSAVVSFALPAFESAIPALVPVGLLGRANSMTELTATLTLLLGPAIAGAAIGAFGGSGAVLLDAVSFLLAGMGFATLRSLATPVAAVGGGVAERLRHLRDGLAYVPRHPVLRWGMALSTSSNVVFGAYDAVLVFYLRAHHRLSAAQVGLVFAIAAAASLVAAAVLGPRLVRVGPGRVVVVTLALQGLGVLLVAAAPDVPALVAAQSLYAGSLTLYTINWRTLRQTITPAPLLGRVSGVSRGVAYAGAAVGGLVGAAALHAGASPRPLFAAEGVVVMAIALVAVRGALVRG